MKKRRRRKLRRLSLVPIAKTLARFFGLGAVADGDRSRHVLFARLFVSASNRWVSAIVFSTVAGFLTFFSQERRTSWGSVLSRGRTSPWTCCTRSKISRLASLNKFLQYLESPKDQQIRQEERSILPSTGYNFFGVAIFSPVLSDFGFAFERALSNHTFYYNYAPVYDNKPFLTTPPPSHEIFVIT